MGVADTGEHGGDVAVFPVQWLATLSIIPRQRRKAALDRRHRFFVPTRSRGLRGDEKADGLRIGRQHLDVLAARPGAKMLPVGGVGAPGVGRARRLNVVAGAIGEFSQMRWQAKRWLRNRRRQRGRGLFAILGIVCGLAHGEHDIDNIRQVVGRRLRRGLIDIGPRAVGRCGARLREISWFLLDVLGHFVYKEQNER
ncbi:hypothetical protein X739_11855 [Mesorhizobium sp. LNHC220B00]|nr:hypothetical protein X739_11855 [Mesorhizobium sp. LNHC220B00]